MNAVSKLMSFEKKKAIMNYLGLFKVKKSKRFKTLSYSVGLSRATEYDKIDDNECVFLLGLDTLYATSICVKFIRLKTLEVGFMWLENDNLTRKSQHK